MSAVLEKNEEQEKIVENLMTQIIKDLNEEAARTEESTREEKNEERVKGTVLLTI